jgi:WD40 repeat protein
MSTASDLQNLITKHSRTLQKLKEQKALLGIHTPHYILIEIEDTEAELEKLQAKLAAIEGRNLDPDALDQDPSVQPDRSAAFSKTKLISVFSLLIVMALLAGLYRFYPVINPVPVTQSLQASPELTAQADPLIRTITLVDVANDLVFTPDGQFLFATSANQGHIQVVRAADGEVQDNFPAPGVTAMAFSPDGKILATADWGSEIGLWSVADRQLFHKFNTSSAPSSLAFAPTDGQILAVGLWDGAIQLWRIDQAEPFRILRGHTDGVTSIAFTPDGQTLASGSMDTTARLWRITEDQPADTLRGHLDRVVNVAFSGDGQILATGSWDTTVKLWRMSDRTMIQSFDGLTGPITSMALTANGQIIAAGLEDGSVKLWRAAQSAIPQILTGHTGAVERLAFNIDGQILASGSRDRTVKLWRIE